MTEVDPRQSIEMRDKIRNKHRRVILSMLYSAPRRYTELVEATNLKPGSLYHHLNVLSPLVKKVGQGAYEITDIGKLVAEELQLVEDRQPTIESGEKEIDTKSEQQEGREIGDVWLSKYPYIFTTFNIVVMISLSIYGVSLAGSAIYRAYSLSLWVDILSLTLGLAALYIIEDITSTYPPWHKLRHVILVRGVTMLPGAVVGLTLLLVLQQGVSISQGAFDVLFAVTLITGWLLGGTGFAYLRGRSIGYSAIVTGVATLIDLLIGLVILLI